MTSPNPNQFENIINQYFMLCTRQVSFMENMQTRMSNVIDTYCENVHTYAMGNNNTTQNSSNNSTNNDFTNIPRRRTTRDTYRPMTSIFGTTPIRQNPFSRPRTNIISNNLSNLPRRSPNPRVRINTRASTTTNTPYNFGASGNSLTNFINNTLNSSTWSHSIPSARDISQACISGTWGVLPFGMISNQANNTRCPITQRDFNNGEEVLMIVHCKHCFCKDQLLRWFQLDSRCPVCRWDIYRAAQTRDASNSSTRIPPPPTISPPPPTISPPSHTPPPPPPRTPSHPFRDELLLNTATNETSLPTIPGVDNTTQTFLRNVTNTIETGLSNVLRNRGIDMSSNIVEASYTFSLPTPPSRGNLFNEETFHIRQQISPITTNVDNSNNIVSNEDIDEFDRV